MSIKPVLLSIAGVVVALFYALESFLYFQASGFAVPLLFKVLICGAGIYLFLRNIKKIKRIATGGSSANSA